MNLTIHLTITFFGILGFLIGSIGIDIVGHHFTKNKFLEHTPIHQPIVILSLIAFTLLLGIGLSLHYIMDYVKT